MGENCERRSKAGQIKIGKLQSLSAGVDVFVGVVLLVSVEQGVVDLIGGVLLWRADREHAYS